jgi:Na+-driven multidrug efflux pump
MYGAYKVRLAENSPYIQSCTIYVHGSGQPCTFKCLPTGLLAQQDSVTPSLSVALSVFISILGNLVFVLGLGYGLIGAGITTVATQ